MRILVHSQNITNFINVMAPVGDRVVTVLHRGADLCASTGLIEGGPYAAEWRAARRIIKNNCV